MSNIFISYASEDRARVKPLAELLLAQGWSVWWDRTIRAGEDFEEVIQKALGEAKSVIVIWSARSIKSRWVKDEARVALKKKVLIPLLIEEVSPPLGFGGLHEANLTEWNGMPTSPVFKKLVADLAHIIGPPPVILEAEEEAKHKAEEEAKRKAEEEAKRKAEEEAKRKAEGEAKRKAEGEAKRKAEEEAKRKAEGEAKRKAEGEAKRKAEEEAKRKAEGEAKQKAEEEAKRKAEKEKPEGEEIGPNTRKLGSTIWKTGGLFSFFVGLIIFIISLSLYDHSSRDERYDPLRNEIYDLLAEADQKLSAFHLTTPEGDNALELYRKVQELDPDNILAQEGFINIIDGYITLINGISRRINENNEMTVLEYNEAYAKAQNYFSIVEIVEDIFNDAAIDSEDFALNEEIKTKFEDDFKRIIEERGFKYNP